MNASTVLIVAAGLALTGAAARADEAAVANTANTATATRTAPATPAKPLDLKAPDITRLYTSEQLEAMLDKMDAQHLEGVEVEGERIPAPKFTPEIWPGIGAPFWALLHPTQAWRIFGPIPPDQARGFNTQPPTTEGYLEPAGVPPGVFEH
jgi:hypothetical protein